jgi:RNA polymerase sigma-70 factor (ECF subfamily)
MREATSKVNIVSETQFLVKRLIKGDEVAFNQFFDEYFPKLYRFALTRVGGNEDLAEELAQATMCKAMTRLKSWRGEAALTTWLFTICRNQLIDLQRSPRSRVVSFGSPDDRDEIRAALESMESTLGQTPEHNEMLRELRHSVQVALDYLPDNYSTALRLKYLEGHSVKHIAQQLEVSVKAAESILTRARLAFREGFGEIAALGRA